MTFLLGLNGINIIRILDLRSGKDLLIFYPQVFERLQKDPRLLISIMQFLCKQKQKSLRYYLKLLIISDPVRIQT